jgi:hypothetical protein
LPHRKLRAAALLAAAALVAAVHGPVAAMDDLAGRYVKLVLAVGVHDADYVDAYYGPPENPSGRARKGRRALPASSAMLPAKPVRATSRPR